VPHVREEADHLETGLHQGDELQTGRFTFVFRLEESPESTETGSPGTLNSWKPRGLIASGSDADIIVFDPEKKVRLAARSLHMKVDYNPYEGREVTGATDTVVSRGRVIVEHGTFTGLAGAGTFLRRSAR
jgi:dihydropyrimidinase